MEATVSNSETCFHVEDEDFDDVFIGFCLVCEINYDVLKLLFIIELNMVLQVLRSVFFNCGSLCVELFTQKHATRSFQQLKTKRFIIFSLKNSNIFFG